MTKTLILSLLIVAALIPTTIFAWDQLDDRLYIKTELEQKEFVLKDELKKEDNPVKQEEIQRRIDGIDNFNKAIELDELMQKAIKDGNMEKQKELQEQFKEINSKAVELAGDRVYIANLTGTEKEYTYDQVSRQSFGIQYAYASQYNDFEFTGTYDACIGSDYRFVTCGFIESQEHPVDISWNHPPGSSPCPEKNAAYPHCKSR